MMKKLNGQTAIITGASRGIGSAIARRLAIEGMNLVLVGRSPSALESVTDEINGRTAQVLVVAMDVTDALARKELVAKTLEAFGSIDLLINNAAQLSLAPYDQLSAEQVTGMVETNLTAPLLLTRLVLPQMLSQGRGHVVMISSLAGKTGVASLETYGATKAGLIAFSAALRSSYRESGVTSSVICPGPVEGGGMYDRMLDDTGLRTPLMLGASSPDDVANAVLRAVRGDLPELIVSPRPVSLLLALQVLFPRLAAWLFPRMGASVYRKAGEIYGNIAGTRPEPEEKGERGA